jgi:hypothetical protein
MFVVLNCSMKIVKACRCWSGRDYEPFVGADRNILAILKEILEEYSTTRKTKSEKCLVAEIREKGNEIWLLKSGNSFKFCIHFLM